MSERILERDEIGKEEYIEDEENESDDGISAKITRLQSKIKHMEYNVDQNIQRGEELSTNCFSLMKSTELLAFDFLLAEYLLADRSEESVKEFLESCIHPKFNLTSGTQEDFNLAVEHVKSLQEIIINAASILLKTDFRPSGVPKHPSEFIEYLKSQREILEKELEEASAENSKEKESEEEEQNEIPEEDLPPVITKWLEKELDFDSAPDDENIELRCLIASVSRRLSNVSKLHKSINNLKASIAEKDEITYLDCKPEDIVHSPFFTGVQGSCVFLMNALKAIRSQQAALPVFRANLEKVQQHLEVLAHRAEDAVSIMSRQVHQLSESVERRRAEAERVREGLMEFINSMENPIIPDFAESEQIAMEHYERLAAEYRHISETGNGDRADDARLQLTLLDRVIEERQKLTALCKEQAELIIEVHEKDKRLFHLIAANKRADEAAMMNRDDQHLLKRYKDSLDEVIKSMDLEKISAWCEQLAEIGKVFRECAAQQKDIEKELDAYLSATESPEVIAAKRAEVEALSVRNYEASMALGEAKLRLETAQEEQFRIQQQLDAKSDWLPPSLDRRNKEAVKRYRMMVECPICHRNRRDTILETCGHVACRQCLESDGQHHCPICQKPFTRAQMRPFYMQ